MSRDLNKVQIIGRLGGDPEIRFTQAGQPIASLNVATGETWTDKQGQRQERTEWHRVSIFGKLAEIAQQYLRKGSKVYLEGQLKTDKYTDKQGMERYSTKIVLNPFSSNMIMLDGRPPGAGGAPQQGYGGAPQQGYGGAPQQGYGGAPQQGYGGPQQGYGGAPQQGYSAPQSTPTAPTAPVAPDNLDQTPDFDDDIPF